MNKLTAEKCRERIKRFKRLKKQFGIAMETELSLQAYEIALPVLEQQEMITDSQQVITDSAGMITDRAESGDDWIEWGGGECPVDGSDIVNVKWEDGSVTHGAEACYLCWDHTGNGDIIAYRVIENDGREG